jgi:hypothetical protein
MLNLTDIKMLILQPIPNAQQIMLLNKFTLNAQQIAMLILQQIISTQQPM